MAAANRTDKLFLYALQTILILVAPALLAATVYMVLSRVIRSVHAEHHSIIRVKWLTRIFVVTDIFSFIVQVGGASLLQNEDIDPDIGKTVILVGLFIQVIAFGLFILAAILFHVRIRREPTTASMAPKAQWRGAMRMLYVVNGLIMVRSVFRIIEYMMGVDSYLFKNEWPLYVFDGVLMLFSVAFYAWWYPHGLKPNPLEDDATYTVPLYSAPNHQPSTTYAPPDTSYQPPMSHEQSNTNYQGPMSNGVTNGFYQPPVYAHGQADSSYESRASYEPTKR